MFSAKTLTTKTITATGYTLSGLISGNKVISVYNSARDGLMTTVPCEKVDDE